MSVEGLHFLVEAAGNKLSALLDIDNRTGLPAILQAIADEETTDAASDAVESVDTSGVVDAADRVIVESDVMTRSEFEEATGKSNYSDYKEYLANDTARMVVELQNLRSELSDYVEQTGDSDARRLLGRIDHQIHSLENRIEDLGGVSDPAFKVVPGGGVVPGFDPRIGFGLGGGYEPGYGNISSIQEETARLAHKVKVAVQG